jgi:tetratricopeptide (TPR) repeat protein
MTDWQDQKEARMRLALGLMLDEIGKYECAADVLRAAIACDPQLVEAHVWLGIMYEGTVRFEEMVGEFMEAIGIDERAARMAVSTEPEEITKIRQILNAWPVSASPVPEDEHQYPPGLPREIREAYELSEAAAKHIGAGRDAEAVEALERAVRLDPVSRPYAALLTFVYVLNSRARAAWASRSVLWEVSPGLARVIFKH